MDSKNKVGVIVQARMGSTRLPGKMLRPLAGKPALFRLIERLKNIQQGEIVIATSTDSQDDVLEDICRGTSTKCIRGDIEDVISRYILAVDKWGFDTVVRLTGDCPLMDPQMVDAMLLEYSKGEYDYFSNLRPRSFPRGLDCEIFPSVLLKKAFEKRIREDCPEYIVIPYVNRTAESLRFGNYSYGEDHSSLRWTLDEQADYDFIMKIYEMLYVEKKLFLTEDILQLLTKNPELKKINANVRQKSI